MDFECRFLFLSSFSDLLVLVWWFERISWPESGLHVHVHVDETRWKIGKRRKVKLMLDNRFS